MTATKHGIRAFRRVREVSLDDLTAGTKERMIRNHLFFEYAEVRERRAVAGQWETYTARGCGTTLQEFMDQFHAFLENSTTGLYRKSRGGDPIRRGSAHWDVYFELESDLDAFTKHFLVLHKLSN